MNSLYVTQDELIPQATQLAAFTNLFRLTDKLPDDGLPYLQLSSDGLAVAGFGFKPLYVHEVYSKLSVRLQHISTELLVQVFRSTHAGKVVWDLTAGLGKDAFILANAGYQVTMVEQNPFLATLVYYALNNKILPSHNLELVFACSLKFIAATNVAPDIIYLDPMFNEDKSAKAKKEMQLIQLLVDTTSDAQELFRQSYAATRQRVIVKRDNKQEHLVTTPLPSSFKSGKTVRFDIYQVSKK